MDLTDREKELLSAITEFGVSVPNLCSKLKVKKRTLDTYFTRLYAKLGLEKNNRGSLVFWAVKNKNLWE